MWPSSFLLRCNGRGLRSAVARAPSGRMGSAPCQSEVAGGKMELETRFSHLAAEGRATIIRKVLRGTVRRTPRSAEGKGAHRSGGFCVSSSEKRRMGKEVGAIIRIESFILCHFSLCLDFSMCERNFSVYVQGPIPSIPTELRHLAAFYNSFGSEHNCPDQSSVSQSRSPSQFSGSIC